MTSSRIPVREDSKRGSLKNNRSQRGLIKTETERNFKAFNYDGKKLANSSYYKDHRLKSSLLEDPDSRIMETFKYI